MPERRIDSKAARKILGVGPAWLYELVKAGQLQSRKMIGRHTFRLADVLACKEARDQKRAMIGKAPDDYLTIAQAAERCGMSYSWVYLKVKQGKIAAEPLGPMGGLVVPEDAMPALLALAQA